MVERELGRGSMDNSRITVGQVLVSSMLSGHSSSPGLDAARSCLVMRAGALPTRGVSRARSRPDCGDVSNGPFVLQGGGLFRSRMVLTGHFDWLLGPFWAPSRACRSWRGGSAPEPGCWGRPGQLRATPSNPNGDAGEVPGRGCPQNSWVRPMAHPRTSGTPGSEMP